MLNSTDFGGHAATRARERSERAQRRVVWLAVLAAVLLAAGGVVWAAPYYGCPQGYTFGVNDQGSAAHCRRAKPQRVGPPICPVTTVGSSNVTLTPQPAPGQDLCHLPQITGVAIAVDPVPPLPCPAGYEYKRNHNGVTDACVQPGGWMFAPPNVQVDGRP